MRKIPKRIAKTIIDALGSGVVPRVGLEHTLVGRDQEIDALLSDIENIGDGGAAFRFISGKYGSGKSFLMQIIRNYSMERNFVVVDGDLAITKRFTGSKKEGRAIYQELIKNMSTRTKPEGGALKLILDKWISNICMDVSIREEISRDDQRFNSLVEKEIYSVIKDIDELTHGYEFGKVINSYWAAYLSDNDTIKQNILKWLRGEYETKTEAKNELGVSIIVTDETWYEFLKVIAVFVVRAGYKGMLVIIDETVVIYKLSNPVSRDNNYEKILTIFNDTMQGKAHHIGFLLGGTPQSIYDTRKGVFSYEALKSRLDKSKFVVEGYKDLMSPIISLEPLTVEELVVLTEKLTELHEIANRYVSTVTEEERIGFVSNELSRVGATTQITPREIIRDYIQILNIILQKPELKIVDIVGDSGFEFAKTSVSEESIHKEFEEFVI